MFSPRLLASLAALLGSTATLTAQNPRLAVVPRIGQTVQVRGTGPKITGRVVHIDPDSVAVTRDRDTVRLPSRLLAQGRVRTGSRPAASTGAYVGGAVGLLVGLIASSQDECHNCWFDISPIGYAVGGMALGAGAGILVGALFKQPIWSRAAVPTAPDGMFRGSLGAGDAVRLVGPERMPIGIVTGGAGDTAIVRLQSGADTAVALASIERYVGERLNRGRNMVYGAASGAIVGALAYVGANNNGAEIPAGEAVGRTVLLTALGAGIGYLTGSKTRHAWASVVPQPTSLRVAPLLRPGGVGAAVTYTF